MCGRYTVHHKPEEIAERFEAAGAEETWSPRYNLAPTQMAPVIRLGDGREMILAKWGLIPFWAKDPAIGNKLINARAETLAEKPSFKNALGKRRCLVPADGFYEWDKRGKGPSRPLYLRLRTGGLFAFAGLWEQWKNPDGEPVQTFTIITVEPNELISTFHNRMPAILRPETEKLWLDTNINQIEALKLLNPFPADEMEALPVSRAVNNPKFDDPSCIETILDERKTK